MDMGKDDRRPTGQAMHRYQRRAAIALRAGGTPDRMDRWVTVCRSGMLLPTEK